MMMTEPGFLIELASVVLVVGVLVLNTYTDVRRRTIWGHDMHYVVFGAAGLALTVAGGLVDGGMGAGGGSGGGYPLTADMLSMAAGITLALILWRCRALASGDCIILLVVAVSLPSLFGGAATMLPVSITLGSIAALAISVILYNLALNVGQILAPPGAGAAGGRGADAPAARRDSGLPFASYARAHPLKKAAALFMAHRKRAWERHVVSIETSVGDDFSLRVPTFGKTDWDSVPPGRLVVVAAPVVPFILAVTIVVVAAAAALLLVGS